MGVFCQFFRLGCRAIPITLRLPNSPEVCMISLATNLRKHPVLLLNLHPPNNPVPPLPLAPLALAPTNPITVPLPLSELLLKFVDKKRLTIYQLLQLGTFCQLDWQCLCVIALVQCISIKSMCQLIHLAIYSQSIDLCLYIDI